MARQSRGVQLGAATTGGNGAQSGPRLKSTGGGLGAGPTAYLWLLVLLEVGTLGLLRYVFRDHHGG